MVKTAFAIVAHPDDIEFMMSGTLMLLKEAGYELHYMNIANGSCGSTEHNAATLVPMRREEAKNAAEFIGAHFHESLTNDLEIFYEKKTLARLASIMRAVAPEIVLLHSPQDYMEDHMNACRLGLTAAFCRGMPNFPVDPPRDIASNDVTLYHAQPHGNSNGVCEPVHPKIFVDVSSVIERKAEMLAFHKSQKDWLDVSQGLDSYIYTMKQICSDVGRLSGKYEFAEGWRRHSHLGFCGPEANPLVDALKACSLNSETTSG
jgi:LmbE family N-acetylglucosaminyl deacetylase